MSSGTWLVRKVAMAAVSVCLCSASAYQCLAQVGGPKLPDPGNPSISRDQQKQIGFQAAAEVYKQMPVSARQQSGDAVHTATWGTACGDDSAGEFVAV